MDSGKFLKRLRPTDWGTYNVEPFDSYQERIKDLLPSWPDCPIEQWLYRHYSDAISTYGWLGFDKFSFQLSQWPNEKLYQQISSHKIAMIDSLGSKIVNTSENRASWLQKYFTREGTWPVPIIILDNGQSIVSPYQERYGYPYHLLEGHLRLGYFRNLFRQKVSFLKNRHSVWVVSIS